MDSRGCNIVAANRWEGARMGLDRASTAAMVGEISLCCVQRRTTVSKSIENELVISLADSFISIDENRSHIDSHVFFVVEMVILSSYALFID